MTYAYWLCTGLLVCTFLMGPGGCSQAQDPAPVSGSGALPAVANAGLVADGRVIAQTHCARCHAIGETGESPRNDAPALRHVLANYAPAALAEDFREHIHVGHADMPDFDFGTRGTDALLAYLVSIQQPAD